MERKGKRIFTANTGLQQCSNHFTSISAPRSQSSCSLDLSQPRAWAHE